MPILTGPQLARLASLPKPPQPSVAIVGKDGKPTAAQTDYNARVDQWLRTLLTILGE